MNKFQIRLRRISAHDVAHIRALRLIGRLGLRKAYELAKHLDRHSNSVAVAGIDAAVAGHLAAALNAAGAEAVIEPSSLATPMMCAPAVNARYKWSGWGPFRLLGRTI
jgi:hypothetical protein